MRTARPLALAALVVVASAATLPATAQQTAAEPRRPFGTLREQAALQQQWLRRRMETVLPALMKKHGVDMWVVPMREYNEDPVFGSIVSPTTFAARRRTIYVFFDRCAAGGAPPPGPAGGCVAPLARGGASPGGG